MKRFAFISALTEGEDGAYVLSHLQARLQPLDPDAEVTLHEAPPGLRGFSFFDPEHQDDAARWWSSAVGEANEAVCIVEWSAELERMAPFLSMMVCAVGAPAPVRERDPSQSPDGFYTVDGVDEAIAVVTEIFGDSPDNARSLRLFSLGPHGRPGAGAAGTFGRRWDVLSDLSRAPSPPPVGGGSSPVGEEGAAASAERPRSGAPVGSVPAKAVPAVASTQSPGDANWPGGATLSAEMGRPAAPLDAPDPLAVLAQRERVGDAEGVPGWRPPGNVAPGPVPAPPSSMWPPPRPDIRVAVPPAPASPASAPSGWPGWAPSGGPDSGAGRPLGVGGTRPGDLDETSAEAPGTPALPSAIPSPGGTGGGSMAWAPVTPARQWPAGGIPTPPAPPPPAGVAAGPDGGVPAGWPGWAPAAAADPGGPRRAAPRGDAGTGIGIRAGLLDRLRPRSVRVGSVDFGENVGLLTSEPFRGGIFTVGTPKGGAGKTTTAIALALSLDEMLEQGKRNARVAYVDGNPDEEEKPSLPVQPGAVTFRQFVNRLRTDPHQVEQWQFGDTDARNLVVFPEERGARYQMAERSEAAAACRQLFCATVVDLVNRHPTLDDHLGRHVLEWLRLGDVVVVPTKTETADLAAVLALLREMADRPDEEHRPVVVAHIFSNERRLERVPKIVDLLQEIENHPLVGGRVSRIPEDTLVRLASAEAVNLLRTVRPRTRRAFLDFALDVLNARADAVKRATAGGGFAAPRQPW